MLSIIELLDKGDCYVQMAPLPNINGNFIELLITAFILVVHI